eukprot:14160265-Alexandrium_andersonii.AAC.1
MVQSTPNAVRSCLKLVEAVVDAFRRLLALPGRFGMPRCSRAKPEGAKHCLSKSRKVPSNVKHRLQHCTKAVVARLELRQARFAPSP